MDGGGTGTIAVIARSGGVVAGQGRAGASSVYSVCAGDALEATRAAVEAACLDAGVTAGEIQAACFGFAGAGREEDHAVYVEIARSVGLSVEPLVALDVEIALDAATLGTDGAILISGTGSVCLGRSGPVVTRAGGHGPLLGDEGSGFDLGKSAVVACLEAAEGRMKPSLLSEAVPAFLGIRSIQDAPALFRKDGERSRIAGLGARVLEIAYCEHDAMAVAIARRAASSLVDLAGAVFSQLGTVVPVWLSGGIFAASPEYAREVAREAGLRYPASRVQRLTVAPVAGAVWRAFRQLGEEMTSVTAFSHVGMMKREPGTASPATGCRHALPITERRNPRSAALSRMSAHEIARVMTGEDSLVAPAVGACSAEIATAIEWTAASLGGAGRLVYVGAGTSGRLGVLDAAECPPTFGVEPGKVVAVIAGGGEAITRSVEGAEDSESAGAAAVDALCVGPADTVVGISASGGTPFTVGAVRRANHLGASTVALVSNPGSPLESEAALTICPVVGPEVLTGSTRLKAATSHKMVLNIISTGAMVLLGKTFRNLMVDVRPLNSKLLDRARRIVAEASGVDVEAAGRLLEASNGSVKAAVVMALLGVGAPEARALLDRAKGSIDRVLDLARGGPDDR